MQFRLIEKEKLLPGEALARECSKRLAKDEKFVAVRLAIAPPGRGGKRIEEFFEALADYQRADSGFQAALLR